MADSNPRGNGLLEKAGNIFPAMLRGMNLGNEFKQRLVLHDWEKIVGRDIAMHARPVKLEFRRLFIRTTHPAWAEQLKYMEYQLKAKINKYAGADVVRELVFTNLLPLADKKPVAGAGLAQAILPELGKELPKVRLTAEEVSSVHDRCLAIEDKALAKSMERLGLNTLRLRRYRQMAGWQPCQQDGCSSLCPPGESYCQSCRRTLRQAKELRLQRLLYDMPWLKYAEIVRDEPCTEQEFESARLSLIQRLASRVSYGDTESVDAITLVMLYRSISPDQLNEQVIRKTLYALRYDLRYVPGKTAKKAAGRKNE